MGVSVYVCVLGVVGILAYVSRNERVKNGRKTECFWPPLEKIPKTFVGQSRPTES
jgi:hypothetical protein